MAPRKDVSKTAKEQVTKMIGQAKESLKLLEAAKGFVKLPKDPKGMTNEKILASLSKLGVATKDELQVLRARIDELEAKLENKQPN